MSRGLSIPASLVMLWFFGSQAAAQQVAIAPIPAESPEQTPAVESQPLKQWPVVYPDESLTLVLVGDTGFGGHLQPVHAAKGMRHGSGYEYAELTRLIAREINGDVAFANLETVITDRNGMSPMRKAFVFRSHPNAVRHLQSLGFNLFSTANNHVGDFGTAGITDTIAHLERLSGSGTDMAAAGLGRDRHAAGTPREIEVRGAKIQLSAAGIGGGRVNNPGQSARPGQMAYGEREDFEETVSRLADADSYRVLSVHYGRELELVPGRNDVNRLRDQAVANAGIDLVVGHHAHVALGVQDVAGKLIFYGLGNFLHLGTQDMSRFDKCRDYGLIARVHLARALSGRLEARAVEVIPITGMHHTPRRMAADQAKQRVRVLNGLARQLDSDQHDARGIRFWPQADGTGLYCRPGSDAIGGKIGALCSGWEERVAAAGKRWETDTIACSSRSVTRSRGKTRRVYRKTRRQTFPSSFFNPFAF